MPVRNSGYFMSQIFVLVVAKNVRICLVSIADLVLRKGGVIKSRILLPSKDLCFL